MRALLASFALSLMLALPISAQQVDEARFDIVIRGFKAGELAFRGEAQGNRYAVAGKVYSTGWVNWIREFSYDATARGTLRDGRYTPSQYREATDTGKRQSTSVMRYRSGVPLVEEVTPPRAATEYDLVPSTQGGTVDPLTTVYAILRDVPRAQACRARLVMFDGRRRSQFTLSDPQPQADGTVVCAGEYRRLAGFSPEDMAERARFPLTMTLAPAGDALRVVEVRTPTLYGDAVLRRK